MANIRLNGQSNVNNVTCFSYAPTVLELTSTNGGSYTIWQLDFQGNFTGMGNDDYWIKVNGITLTRVANPNDAKGLRFYMTDAYQDSVKKRMVDSVVEALRKIPELMAGYEVYIAKANNAMTTSIIIKARNYGLDSTPLEIDSNIGFLKISHTMGSATTEFKNGNLRIDVNRIYPPRKYNGADTSTGSYITTLSKHTANDASVKFDLGSVFASLTDEGEVAQFALHIYQVNDADLVEIATYNKVYNVNGYMVNQGGEFIPRFDNVKVALNAGRGENREYLNNTILYVYENTIPLSVYASDNINSIKYKLVYVGSDNTPLIDPIETTVSVSAALNHLTIRLSDNYLAQSKYVDLDLGEYGKLRFNVIKPVRATDECQRVYWYNSWGGVSFFDFTGNRTEERKVKVQTYQDSVLNYYDNNTNERDYIYDKTNEITVKLTTHNIHKDGQWSLFDLQQSRTAWTYVNGERYRIIVSDLTINTTSVTDIYTATVEYTYSLGINA